MLERTMDAARERGVESQVEVRVADVATLPFADGDFDLVVSFTGLHCFPEPHGAVTEMVRVLRAGGVLTGSAVLNDTGRRYEPMRRMGRVAGLLGPSCTGPELHTWLEDLGMTEVTLRTSGAICYFRGVRG
jgi:ubiquinone/menaquinone biosynthesis C-methylase UbiE